MKKRLGLIGARGYVGGELMRLLAAHSGLEPALVSSRQLIGQKISENFEHPSDALIRDLGFEDVAELDLDAWVLALPNGLAPAWVEAIRKHDEDAVILDLGADYRFDSTWTYGFTERFRDPISKAKLISNPGCYATAMQVAIWPILEFLDGPAHAFGVSGYSGAGTTPSEKNNPERLRDNLIPYALTGHIHEREVSTQMGHTVRFMPHVAAFFRGINITLSAPLKDGVEAADIWAAYEQVWGAEPLIHVEKERMPEVAQVAGAHHVGVGGVSVKDGHLVVVSVIDNLLKGAATQALQNLNLALGFDELDGISAR